MKGTAIIAAGALCVAACSSPPKGVAGSGANGTSAQSIGDAAPTGPSGGGTASTGGAPGPIPDDNPHCEAYVPTKTPLSTAWVDKQAASGHCSSAPPSVTVANNLPSAAILYADCTPIGNTPSRCTLTVNMQTCENHRWTKLCQHNSDCPTDSLCLSALGTGDVPSTVKPRFGTCEKKCNAAGSAQCGRCGLACDLQLGVCRPYVAPSDGGV